MMAALGIGGVEPRGRPAPGAAPLPLPTGAPVFVEVAGRRIRYLRKGRREGTPVVLVHGFGGDMFTWMFNHGPIGTRCPALALDLPGHGGSSHDVGDGSVEALAQVLGGFLTALEIPRAHLVGHSLGGAVVLGLALRRPEAAASLTLLGPAGFGPEMHPTFLPDFICAADRDAMGRLFGLLFGRPSAFVTGDLLDAALVQRRLAANDAALARIAAANFHGGRQNFALKPRLGEVEAPVKVVWGSADRIVPAGQARGLPGTVALHLFEGGGHMMHMEEPQAVNRLILENSAVEP